MKVRQSNYELMRIVSMLLIIIYHILIHGNVLNHTTGVLNFIFLLLICITLVHVNSFVLVTGYFNYDKEFKWKKFWNIFLQAWFYQIIIVIILLVTGLLSIGGSYTLINVLSPLNYNYWFIVCYLMLYLVTPFLNRLIINISQKEHKKLIILLFCLFCVIPFVTRQDLVSNDGFTLIQFVFMYFVGSYFRKYPIDKNYHFVKFSKNKLQIILFGLMIFFCIAHFVSCLLSSYFLSFDNPFFHDFGDNLRNYFTYYSSPFVIIQSVCYFLWFGTLTIKSKFINFIASLVFGVYLIHDNDFIRPIIYRWLGIDIGAMITGNLIVFKVFIYALLIFVVCIIVEFIRSKLFKFISNRKIVKKINFKIKKYILEM